MPTVGGKRFNNRYYKYTNSQQLLFDYRGHWASQLNSVSDNTCDIVAIEESTSIILRRDVIKLTGFFLAMQR